MKILSKVTGCFLAAAVLFSSVAATAQETADSKVQSNGSFGAYAAQGMRIQGNSGVHNGDVFVENGDVDMASWSALTPGATLYKNADNTVSGSAYQHSGLKDQVKDYAEVPFQFDEYAYPEVPADLPQRENVTADWEYQNAYYEISESGAYDKIDVKSNGKLAFVVDRGETLTISVDRLSVNGEISVVGEGKVFLFVNKFHTGNTTINPTGTKEQLSIVFAGNAQNASQTLTNVYACNADFFSRSTAIKIEGQSKLNSAFYVSKPVTVGSSVEVTGLIYAPTVDLAFNGSSVIKGFVVGKTITLTGSAVIIYGETTMDFGRFDKPAVDDPSVEPAPELSINGEGKVISETVVSRTENIPAYTLRFSTGPVNYGLWVAGTVEDGCEIFVNDEKAYVSKETNEWSKKIELKKVQRGTNDVIIRIVNQNGDEITTKYVYDAYFPPVPPDMNNVPGTELYDVYVHGKPNNGTIMIKGTYYDAYDVKPVIFVNGVKASVARMNDEEQLPFRHEENEFWATIPVPAGHADITIEAMNCYGVESQTTLNVFYFNDIDPATAPAPSLTGRAGSANAQAQAYIAGVVSDLNDTTVAVTVNGQPAYIGADGAYSVELPVVDGLNRFTIVATNVYGKQTTVIATRTYNLK